MQITDQEHIGPTVELLVVPIIPATATADEMEAIVAVEGGAVLSEEPHARLECHFRQGGTPEGSAL